MIYSFPTLFDLNISNKRTWHLMKPSLIAGPTKKMFYGCNPQSCIFCLFRITDLKLWPRPHCSVFISKAIFWADSPIPFKRRSELKSFGNVGFPQWVLTNENVNCRKANSVEDLISRGIRIFHCPLAFSVQFFEKSI